MNFDLQLAGRRALVTGGTRGVGAAVVQALHEAGVQVVATALSLDADISFAHAAFAGVDAGQASIPGALENVVASGVTYSAPGGVFSSVRLRHFGSYPLTEDNALRARASNLVNADIGYRLRSGTRIQLTMLNVLNGAADDIQYAYASRLKGETSDGVDDVHFHPAEPRQVRMSVEWRM